MFEFRWPDCFRGVRLGFCVVLTLFMSRVASADDWCEFRGNTGQGTSRASRLPTSWDASTNVVWKVPVAGKGWSSPVIHDGRIYVTTAVPLGSDFEQLQSLNVVCLDAATGESIWKREVFQQPVTAETSIHAKNSFASPTPIIHNGRLYVHFGPNGTAALDLEGKILWENRQIKYDARHGNGGSPIICDGKLIFSCDGVEKPFVVALNLEDGAEAWRTYRPEMEPERFSFATPLAIDVDGTPQVVCPGSNFVCSYQPDSGEEIWRVQYAHKWSVIPRPAYSDGLVYVCTGYEGPAEVLAIRPDGQGDVTDTHIAWRSNEYVPHTPSPLVVNERLFLVNDNGIATCRDARSGELLWKKRLGGTFSASPLYADGHVYFPDENGNCTVVEASDQFEKVAENALDERTLASYAVVDQALIVRTADHLFRIQDSAEASPK